MLLRGTESRSRQQIKDELDKYLSEMDVSTTSLFYPMQAPAPGMLMCQIKTKRENLLPVLEIMADVIDHPAFPESELETLKQQVLAIYEQQRSEPQMLARLELTRKMRPFEPGDPRYVASLEESIEAVKNVTADDLRGLYRKMMTGRHGELTIVGDFDPSEVMAAVQPVVDKLQGDAEYARLTLPPTAMNGEYIEINTPDKANAVYFAGAVFPLRDDHEDYPSLLIGNEILGGAGALASRLGDRVRQQEGLSYGIGSVLKSSSHDNRSELLIYAISNPENLPKVRQAIEEEIDRIRRDGVTEEEVKKAIAGYIESQKVARTNDGDLASLLGRNAEADRTMQFTADLEAKIRALRVDDVNEAVRKYIDHDKLVIAAAGDFGKKP